MLAPVLLTERLRLDAVRADDAERISMYCSDPELQRYVPVPVPYTSADADDYAVNYARAAADGDGALWAIRWASHSDLLGVIELKPEPLASAEIGFWLGAPHRAQGIMTEAARAVRDWSFSLSGLGLGRMFWQAVVGNVGSASVARSCGFRYEGLSRGALVHRGERLDAWRATLLSADSRDPQPGWPVA